VLLAFLRLGVTSFGGPVAHLGYFRAEFVERRKWLDEAAYVDIVALCQFLPGPASSQVGITLGTLRAGLPGALAAWFGFTMPSAVAMIAFGYGVAELGDISRVPWLHGLKIVAVAVVAQAVWGMARSLCPDRARATLAVGAAMRALAVPSAAGQIGAIIAGGLIGWRLFPETSGNEAAPLAVHIGAAGRGRRARIVLRASFRTSSARRGELQPYRGNDQQLLSLRCARVRRRPRRAAAVATGGRAAWLG